MFDLNQSIELHNTAPGDLADTITVLSEWQFERDIIQLHPGDLGWFERFGPEKTAASIRRWTRGNDIVAIGLLDGKDLLRLGLAPSRETDASLAQRMAKDISTPSAGILPKGKGFIETRSGELLRNELRKRGWNLDEAWTSLKRDLGETIEKTRLRIETVNADLAPLRTQVQRASFKSSTFTEQNWHEMAAGAAYASARCIVGFDEQNNAVACATVWSAGNGRPGLIEPLGVHRDQRRKGYGREIAIASLAVLRELGSSSATVCTDSSNEGAIATYKAAGFSELRSISDLAR